MKYFLIIVSFLIACGSEPAPPPTTIVYTPEKPAWNARPTLDLDKVELRCFLPEGLYYVTGELKNVSCNIDDLMPDEIIKTLWHVNERLPCREELHKIYYVDTLNLYTGEECPTVITDKIITSDSPAFLMNREVTVRCAPGICNFTYLFSAWRPET